MFSSRPTLAFAYVCALACSAAPSSALTTVQDQSDPDLSAQFAISSFLAADDPRFAADMAAAHPLLRYRVQGGSAALFDGEPPASVQALGRRIRPSLVDLFIALTRAPEAERTQF